METTDRKSTHHTLSNGLDGEFDDISAHHQDEDSRTGSRGIGLHIKRRRPVYTAQHVFLAVDFSRRIFRVVWLIMLVLRLWCVFFLVWTARLYWFVAHPYMSYYATLIGPSAVANFKPMGVVFGAIAALHARQVYKMLYYTFYYRMLVLGPPPRSLGPSGESHCFKDWNNRFRSPYLFIRSVRRDLYWVFFDRHGPFGVESPLFHLRVHINELIEIVSQTTQVYNASVLVSKVWMNNLYVAVTVLNSWSTPILQRVYQKLQESRETAARGRFACLTVDFLLDSATGMVIPLLIFMPYYQKFDFSAYNFELIYLYDDIWFANMVMENQQILAQNKWDFVWKIVPHLSIYGSLNSLRALIRPPSTLSTRVYCAVSQVPPQQPVAPLPRADMPGYTAQNDTRDQFGESKDADPFQPPPKPPKLVPKFPVIHEGRLLSAPSRGVISHDLSFLDDITGPPSHLPSRYSRMIQTVITLILFIAGTAILVLHLRAAWKAFSTDIISCTTMTRPWFASKVSCSTVRHNCHMHNSTEVTNEDLSMIEPSSVAALVFSHCPTMFVPTVITEFHNLLGIDFFNCTLHEWTKEAAITAQAHPRLTYIILIRVNMTRLPDGVLQPLPDTMTDFEISVSNLTELPADLHERWKPMSIFYVEHALLTEFPPTLMHLQVSDLSLIGNQIDRLPEFHEDAAFVSFAMTHTPLTELPNSMGDVSKLAFLDLAYTRLASFPIWMKEVAATATKINIHHTPFCESMSSQEIEENYGDNAVMCCLNDMDVRQSGKYPLQILAPNRLYDDPKMVPKTTTPISKADLYG